MSGDYQVLRSLITLGTNRLRTQHAVLYLYSMSTSAMERIVAQAKRSAVPVSLAVCLRRKNRSQAMTATAASGAAPPVPEPQAPDQLPRLPRLPSAPECQSPRGPEAPRHQQQQQQQHQAVRSAVCPRRALARPDWRRVRPCKICTVPLPHLSAAAPRALNPVPHDFSVPVPDNLPKYPVAVLSTRPFRLL